LPILYYGLEACPINKAQLQSLDFVLHSSFRKFFYTKSTNRLPRYPCMSVPAKVHGFQRRPKLAFSTECIISEILIKNGSSTFWTSRYNTASVWSVL